VNALASFIFNFIASIGAWVIGFIESLGGLALFLVEIISRSAAVLKRPSLLIKQMYSVGVKTLLIIIVSGVFVGMVLGLQFNAILENFGAESQLGLGVALTLVRELGPVFTGLLFSGRACSALTAEIGLMKATQQLDAMEMMAVNPVDRVIAPRYWAGVISVPLLAAIFTSLGVFGGYFIGVTVLGGDSGLYWSVIENGTDFYEDILNGFIKATVFGVVITLIAVMQGYRAAPTSEGVSAATTRTVVVASLAVLGLDFILTSLMFA